MDATPHANRSLLTRRAGLALLGAGGLGVLAAGTAAAQAATPGALPPALAEWIAGWQALDADRVAAYAADGVHIVVATGQTFAGRAAIRANVAALMRAFPDATLGVDLAFAAGDRGAVAWRFAGHYTHPYPGFPSPSRQALAFRAAILFRLAGGQVVRADEYYDLYGLFVQLGLLPAPGGAATPAATPRA